MKKITLFLTMLVAMISTAMAQVEFTTDQGATIGYKMNSRRKGIGYPDVVYDAQNSKLKIMSKSNEYDESRIFYFKQGSSEGTVKIYPYAAGGKVVGVSKANKTYSIVEDDTEGYTTEWSLMRKDGWEDGYYGFSTVIENNTYYLFIGTSNGSQLNLQTVADISTDWGPQVKFTQVQLRVPCNVT